MKNLTMRSYAILRRAIFSGVQFFYFLTKPKSKNEDNKRREFILNILLVSTLTLLLLMLLMNTYKTIYSQNYEGMSPIIILVIFLAFMGLYLISKIGLPKISSTIFLFLYFIPVTYMFYNWGANVPQGILMYSLIIVMSGILVGTRFAFISTLLLSSTLFLLSYLQIKSITIPNSNWKDSIMTMRDVTVYIITFFIIAIVSWLSNREIERSLKRAWTSEAELKKERDMLEIKVEEKTKELRRTQMEKMQHLLRFAEFGRLSSGLFHDLINPMTAVSLNLQQVKDEGKEELVKAKTNLNQAIKATKRMEDFIMTVRKQLQKQESKTLFPIDEEIRHATQLLAHKARKHNVSLILDKEKIKTFGNQIKFNQAVVNFISNAIDSYKDLDIKDKKVYIDLSNKNNTAFLSIKDAGCGIAEENLNKIFEPFFTTKEGGIGLGLSSSKNTIENDFQGTLGLKSSPGKGTEILITFPILQNGKNQ